MLQLMIESASTVRKKCRKIILGNVPSAARLRVHIHKDLQSINEYREANHNRLGKR
jgi:hypothetical protein